MYIESISLLFSLIRSVTQNKRLNDEEITILKSEEKQQEILEISKKHDLSHFIILFITINKCIIHSSPLNWTFLLAKKFLLNTVYRSSVDILFI